MNAPCVLDLVPSESPRDESKALVIGLAVLTVIMIGIVFWVMRADIAAG